MTAHTFPKNKWNRVVREALLVPDARGVLAASDDEIKQRLRDGGVDLAEVKAMATASYEKAVAKFGAKLGAATDEKDPESAAWVATTAPVVAARGLRGRPLWIAGAIAAAAAVGTAAYLASEPQKEEPKPEPPPVNKPAPPVVHTAAPPPVVNTAAPADTTKSDKASDKGGK